jgi:hypothetical protein
MYGCEMWVLNKGHIQRSETAQMKFLRQLLGCTKLGCQRNADVKERLRVCDVVEGKRDSQGNWRRLQK